MGAKSKRSKEWFEPLGWELLDGGSLRAFVFRRHYPAGHYYDDRWLKSDLFCPSCGKREVWVENSPGDYYEGPEHLCTHCKKSWHLSSYPGDSNYAAALKEVVGDDR